MKRILVILTFCLASTAGAQTTSTDAGPSTCLGASHYPPETAYSFQCVSSGSIVFPAGQDVQHFQFYGAHVELWTSTFTPAPGNAWGEITAVTNFVAPTGCSSRTGVKCTNDGSIAFTWEQPGSDGVTHTGSFSATVNGVPDWRGWFHPILTNITMVVN